jgi:hypothetical protein
MKLLSHRQYRTQAIGWIQPDCIQPRKLTRCRTRCQAVPHIWKSVLTEYFANRHFDVANALDTMTPDQCQIVQSLAETVLSYEVKFALFFIIILIVILTR